MKALCHYGSEALQALSGKETDKETDNTTARLVLRVGSSSGSMLVPIPVATVAHSGDSEAGI